MRFVQLPNMPADQEASWRALIELSVRVPTGWCVVGGQMVHLHGWERGVRGLRATNDGDAVLDIRSRGDMLLRFTTALEAIGFVSSGESMEGHQHRWERENAQIDVLIPTGIGERAALRKGASGGTTIQAPGAQGRTGHCGSHRGSSWRRFGNHLLSDFARSHRGQSCGLHCGGR